MRTSTTRTVPPPIDLSVSGSDLRRVNSRSTSEREQPVMDHHPYAYSCRYTIDSDEAVSHTPVPTGTLPTTAPQSSPSSSETTQMLTPNTSNCHKLTASSSSSSSSDCSFLSMSISEWEDSKLVPNRRRRSYSESEYSPDSSSIASQRSASGSTTSASSRSPNTLTSNSQPCSMRPSLSFGLGLRNKLRTSPSVDSFGPRKLSQQHASAGGRNKLWSSITHAPLSANAGLDFGCRGGDMLDVKPSKEKVRRPGTSPSILSSYVSFIDTDDSSASANIEQSRVNILERGNSKKRQRPGTASSANSSPSMWPQRASKFDWPWQWKRLSFLKTPSSPISTRSSTPPSSASFTSSAFSPLSPDPPPTPWTPDDRRLRTKSSVKFGPREGNNLKVLSSPNSRNRSTPNLKVPHLSKEDLGKVNAFYAPPPIRAAQAPSDVPRRRNASSDPKPKHIPPVEIPKSALKPVPIRTGGIHSHKNPKGIPITLPLSPVRSVGGYSNDDDSGVIYLTVVEDEGNSEEGLRLVEIPM